MSDFDDLSTRMGDMNDQLGQSTQMVAAFSGEMSRLQSAMAHTEKDMKTLERGLSSGLRRAFDGVVFDGMKLSDALRGIGQTLANTAYNAAMKPVTDHIAGLASGALGSILPFAKGGVVNGPTMFPMQGGTGLMGEAGPEAIMPLTRGPDGRLGVAAQGGARGGGVNVTMNITTPDATSFRRSQSQIAAQMSRALGRGNRNA